jgi:hypothetical protein
MESKSLRQLTLFFPDALFNQIGKEIWHAV